MVSFGHSYQPLGVIITKSTLAWSASYVWCHIHAVSVKKTYRNTTVAHTIVLISKTKNTYTSAYILWTEGVIVKRLVLHYGACCLLSADTNYSIFMMCTGCPFFIEGYILRSQINFSDGMSYLLHLTKKTTTKKQGEIPLHYYDSYCSRSWSYFMAVHACM